MRGPAERPVPRVVHDALEHCARRAQFHVAWSAGLLGSWARGDSAPVSDVDFFFIAPDEAREEGAALQGELLELGGDLQSEGGGEFSVFWTTRGDLAGGEYAVGRWPAYDRVALVRDGWCLAGPQVGPGDVRLPNSRALRREAADFLLGTMMQRLSEKRFFDRLAGLDARGVQRMGPVVLTKSVLMPTRLLYQLCSQAESVPVAPVEEAVAVVHALEPEHAWWPLVRAALAWRRSPPGAGEASEQAARLLRECGGALYADLLGRYERAMTAEAQPELARSLSMLRRTIPGVESSVRAS